MLCIMCGVALIAATKHSDATINTTEIRTQRIALVDDQGKR